jgi:hypothetical protein
MYNTLTNVQLVFEELTLDITDEFNMILEEWPYSIYHLCESIKDTMGAKAILLR